jgi:hypothetical protein
VSLRDLLRQVGLEEFAPDGAAGDRVIPVARRCEPIRPQGDREAQPSRWRAWGIPGEAIRLLSSGAGGPKWRETAAMAGVREIVALRGSGRTWGLLAGGLGSGKSVAAGWWLVNVPSSGGAGRIFIAAEDVAALPAGTVWAEERFEKLATASALVLDDVGRGDAVGVRDPDTGEERKRMHQLVQRLLSRRYDNRFPTLCTGNLHPRNDWPAYLGDERLRDRWREVGVARGTTDASLRGGHV